jgi:beta-lactamase regulating signal transducer with metallopeptidase domain
MNISTTYLLNVALHAAVLSVFASLVLMALRHARHRSVAAIAGLLAVGFLPWLTALRPAQPIAAAAPKIEAQHEAPALPTWTVVTLPAPQKVIPAPTEPAAAPAKFVFPDPLHTLVILWATGAGVGLLLLTIATLKVGRWRKSLVPLDAAAWQSLQTLSSELPAQRHFLLCKSTASPCVTGLFRPRIVLPKFLLEPGSENELRWAVRHEVAHWQAGDSRWMMLFALIRCTNWWNPLVHRLVSQWSEAREQLCDLHATSASENRADYGEFLIAMARKLTSPPALAVAMAKSVHARRLKQRIISLLEAKANSRKPAGKTFVVISSSVFIGCATFVSSVKINAEEPVDDFKPVRESAIVEEQPTSKPAEAPPAVPQPPAVNKPVLAEPVAAPPQGNRSIKITSKFVLTDFEPGFAESMSKEGRFSFTSIFSEDQIQVIMRGLAQKRGTGLMTAPSVSAKPGETTTIEAIREVPGTPEQVAKRDPKSGIPFVGISLNSVPRFTNELPPRIPIPNGLAELVPAAGMMELEQTVDYRFVPGIYQPVIDSGTAPKKGTNPETIKTVKRSINGRIPSGFTVCSDLGEIEPGKFLTVFTRLDAIDDAGRLLDENGKLRSDDSTRDESIPTPAGKVSRGKIIPPDALPSPEVKGKLRLNAVFVEIPLKKPRPSGEQLVIGLTPSDPKVAAGIQKTPGAKVRTLKTVEMPLGKRGTPWPEFPGLSVSAIASKDFKLITITSHTVGNEPGQFPNIWEEMSAESIMNFGIKNKDTKFERRLLITIDAGK